MQILTTKKFGSIVKKEGLKQQFSIFQKKTKCFILLLDSKPIAGALCFYSPTTAYLAMAPYQPIAENYLTNTLPICASIRYACDKGYQNYEMGVTSTETLAYHKEKFCAIRIPLMMYHKEFSSFKMGVNKITRPIVRAGKKIVDLFDNND
jgi:lipid II:glycine glycyltransferase (peptidoglycan interpeptide bridge formation enzyme)